MSFTPPKKQPETAFVLYGDSSKIAPYLEYLANVEVVHTSEKIESTDSPVEAVRKKKTSLNGVSGSRSETRCG
ncbi:fatty acid/phospholipid synthesis protein PlsX [Brochothrix campestris FSL F6-1037]|uniref:Fatty acid/phospholipid synthesis protein PlsX n=1 Tax=Brochothrix campestris FSL F6-1037 TaxID=1265861 RepID=W7D1P8_9LIST|nr:fatty acid/phospholipid synthesis protein PlsX [Brochothrix campestris FSL F6-1037]